MASHGSKPPFRSKIWNFFKIADDDNSTAICNSCQKTVCRGGKDAGNYTTTNLVSHLKRHHLLEEYAELQRMQQEPVTSQQSKAPKNSRSKTQPTLLDTINKGIPWPKHHKEAIKYNRLIAQMIAIDSQCFSMVEDVGFNKLMKVALPKYNMPGRKYFTDKEVPALYKEIKSKLQQEINTCIASGGFFSFTTDIWSRDGGQGSMISLTGHFGAVDCKPRVLQISPFEGSHTGKAIGEKLTGLLTDWNIPADKVHAIVSDNGANVKLGLRLAELPGVGCAIHTLQLVVEKGLKSQRVVIDLISRGRRIAGHFKHSTVSNDRLRAIQTTYNVVSHMLVQDVPTRWDSTYAMLERLLEQKKALIAYDSNYGLPDHMSANEWSLMKKLVAMLEPFQRTTKDLSRHASSISQVIPFIKILKSHLEQETGSEGILTAQECMRQNLTERSAHAMASQLHYAATFLDPRFKDRFLDQVTIALTKDYIEELCAVIRYEDAIAEDLPTASTSQTPNPQVEALDEAEADDLFGQDQPSPKRQKFNIWEKINAKVGNEEKGLQTRTREQPVKAEIAKYVSEPAIQLDQDTSPITWWKSEVNAKQFPLLHPIAIRFLSCPPSSVASESVFSITGNIDSDRRKRLLTENVEILGFIKCNHDLL